MLKMQADFETLTKEFSLDEKEMTMDLPRPIYDTWKAVADKFKALHQGDDDARRLATRRGVQTIRARHRGGVGVLDGSRYCCKTEHANLQAQSKDALAFVPDGLVEHGRLATMFMFDMINGGSRETNPFPVGAHNHEENPPNPDAFILLGPWPEGDAFDWLAGEPVTPITPTPPEAPPAPVVDLNPVLERLASLEERLATLQGRAIDKAALEAALEALLPQIIVEGRTDSRGIGPLAHSHGFSGTVRRK